MEKQQIIKIKHPITGRVFELKTLEGFPTLLELSINDKKIGVLGMSEIREYIQKC